MSRTAILPLILFLGSVSAFGAPALKALKVSGDKEATVFFQVADSDGALPKVGIQSNVVELTFANMDLTDNFREHSELSDPHPLIHRVAAYSPERGLVRARIVVNGSVEGLAERAKIAKTADGFSLNLTYPKGVSPAASFLNDEQLPIAAAVTATKPVSKDISFFQVFVLVLVLIGAGAGTYFFARFIKKKGAFGGSRKYLIEQMSYCPIGPKTGVSLLKVGTEFVLVGVTPNQVNLITSLPKMGVQYESESSLERDDFKVAVNDELSRLRPKTTRSLS